jgi:hypothetical protein
MSKYRGNLVHVAEAVRQHGRGGDDILVHVNPEEFAEMKAKWGPHTINPHTGLPEYGLLSKLKKALKFEAFNVKGIIKDIAKNPQRLLTGAVDPLGTKISNKMFGTHYDPAVNQLGGATEKRFADAEAKGMDTGLARDLHKAAGLVAGFYGAQGLSGLANAGINNLSSAASDLGGASSAAGALGEGIAPIDTSIISQAGIPQSVTSGLGDLASSGSSLAADGVMPLADTSILSSGIPSSVTSGIESAAPGLGQQALNYAKDWKNWPTIAKGMTALGGIAGVGSQAGGGGGAAPPVLDPGYSMNPQYDRRNFQDGDYSKYYNYGEGPEHSYYTYGTMPKDVWTGDQSIDPEQGYAAGGRLHHSGLGVPLSNQSRYMQDGPGSGRGDEIDAKLSPKEFVMDAETVAMLGDGNPDHGAKKLDEMRRKIRMHKGKALAKGKFSPNAKDPLRYLK